MEISTRKTLWWYALGGGSSATLFFIFLCSALGSPRSEAFLWPAVSLPMAVTAIFKLRKWYRLEPAEKSGWWHLSLSDLMFGTMATGFILAIARSAFNPSEFKLIGIAGSIMGGAMLLAGNLIAASQGVNQFRRRILFSISFWLKVLGSMGILSFTLLVLIILLMNPSELLRFVQEVFALQVSHEGLLIVPLRLGFLFLPAGILMGRWCKPSVVQQPPLS